MRIREEAIHDHAAVRQVLVAAFETSAEADLVEALREQAGPLISLVAEVDQSIVGHIVFSPVHLTGFAELRLAGLAPMAVVPTYQRRGIGGMLIHEGLKSATRAGVAAVVVLGHPAYYPRFGFVPASRFSMSCGFEVSQDAFMVRELTPGVLAGKSGQVNYHPAFDRF